MHIAINTHTHTHADTHTHTHTRARARARMHTHTHARIRSFTHIMIILSYVYNRIRGSTASGSLLKRQEIVSVSTCAPVVAEAALLHVLR